MIDCFNGSYWYFRCACFRLSHGLRSSWLQIQWRILNKSQFSLWNSTLVFFRITNICNTFKRLLDWYARMSLESCILPQRKQILMKCNIKWFVKRKRTITVMRGGLIWHILRKELTTRKLYWKCCKGDENTDWLSE